MKFKTRSFQVCRRGSVCNQIEFFLSYLYLILGYHHMDGYRKEVELDLNPNTSQQTPRHSEDEEITLKQNSINPHVAFEKNYPKNIFIPLIQHLNQRGLKDSYEACVGTRQSFQGKNVVSLAEIHKLLSQPWFTQSINLTALVSNMSNKILLNSKIKKKLFHLLLVRQLFKIPLDDSKEFKKQVSKKANQVSQQKLIDDSLFNYPSALIYLLRLFAGCLESGKQTQKITEIDQNQLLFASQLKRGSALDENSHNNLNKEKQQQTSSKEEYKLYISKIISNLNSFRGDVAQILDLLEQTKQIIAQRQTEIRSKYKLPAYVPQWSYFSSIVIYNCQLVKRNRQKVTYSMLNQWIQEFRQASTTLQGFKVLVKPEEPITHSFTPIILIAPPVV